MKKNFFLIILMIMSCVNTFAQDVKVSSEFEEKSEETKVFETVLSGGKERDQITAVASDGTTVVLRSCDRYGLSLLLKSGVLFSPDNITSNSGFGFEFDSRRIAGEVSGYVGKTHYSEKSSRNGKSYWTGGAVGLLKVKPLVFGDDHHRFYLLGGGGYEWYQTDTKKTEGDNLFQSSGNYIYWKGGMEYSYSIRTTGNKFSIFVGVRPQKQILRNVGEKNKICAEVSAKFYFGINRHKLSVCSLKAVRRMKK